MNLAIACAILVLDIPDVVIDKRLKLLIHFLLVVIHFPALGRADDG